MFDSSRPVHYYSRVLDDGKGVEDGDWAYGDAWKNGSPDDPVPGAAGEYVEVLRGDTGMGYSDTVMLEYVLFLGEQGIDATFDSYPLEQIKIYVLKVEAGKEEEALRLLEVKRANSA